MSKCLVCVDGYNFIKNIYRKCKRKIDTHYRITTRSYWLFSYSIQVRVMEKELHSFLNIFSYVANKNFLKLLKINSREL